ncbi:sigma-E factor negative regulatory protein [Lysobacter fragariae]
MTSNHHQSKHHQIGPRDERESLSALFDGELPRDAARFALKRLDHDAGWRDSCGRWQLIGDAMRGQATAAAPADFAAGVMRKLVAEGQVAAAPQEASALAGANVAVQPGGGSRRWIGGAALAASVAFVAVLAVRPFSQSSVTDPTLQVAAQVAPASDASKSVAAAVSAADSATQASGTPEVRSIAAVDTQRDRRNRTLRTAPRAAGGDSRPTESVTSVDAAATIAVAPSHKPFHPPTDEITTRPWPRAVLPDSASGAFTASFGTAPSFYPFEPRVPSEPAPPAQDEPHR